MLLTPVLCLAILPQERPLVTGAYRGPYDEVLIEQSARTKDGVRNAASLDGWERWEFWYEHERGNLFTGHPRFSRMQLSDAGTYGGRDGALMRDEVVGQAVPLLEAEMKSAFPSVREAAALALGRIGESSSLELLKEAAGDPIAQVRQAALLGLDY